MTTTTKAMNVSLTPQLEQLVRSKVESGQYNSASEVVREAIRVLELRDEMNRIKLEKLRAEIQIGLDQLNAGEVSELDIEDVIRRGRERHAAKTNA